MHGKHLEKKQWGKSNITPVEPSAPNHPQTNQFHGEETKAIILPRRGYNIQKIVMEELKSTINALTKIKAPGPDEVTSERMQAIIEESALEMILKLLNQWWEEEEVEQEVTQARVASIYKKKKLGTTGELQTNLTTKPTSHNSCTHN